MRWITLAGRRTFFPKIQGPVSTTTYDAPTSNVASSTCPIEPSVASTSNLGRSGISGRVISYVQRSVCILLRIPGLRRYPLIRVLELVGGAALLVKAAEAIRDWDARGGQQQRIVIDV